MTAREDDAFGVLDLLRRALGHFGGASEIVFAGEKKHRQFARDFRDLVAVVGIDAVEIQIALEDTGPALGVIPPGFPSIFIRAFRRHQAKHRRRHHFAAMDVRVVKRIDPPTGGVVAGLERDESQELVFVT